MSVVYIFNSLLLSLEYQWNFIFFNHSLAHSEDFLILEK